MKEKVRLHKKRRKDEWFTVETYKNFENELSNFFENNEFEVWKTIKKKGECGSYYRTMKYVIY